MDRPLDYMPQLDGLRAVAVALVIYSHYIPPQFKIPFLGRSGVLLFFVLSGFLITSILIHCRDSGCSALMAFCIRRGLRLLPVYYFYLAVIVTMGQMDIENLWWFLLYAQNFGFAFADLDFQLNGHLWSLAVEEQFYLLWPAVVFLVPLKHLARVLCWVIALSIAYRTAAALIIYPANSYSELVPIQFPMFACMDTLAIGSLLALHVSGVCKLNLRAMAIAACPAVLVLVVAGIYGGLDGWPWLLRMSLFDTSIGVICFWVVDLARRGNLTLLAWKPIRYVGKISYGVYVYHLIFALWFWPTETITLARGLANVGIVFMLSVATAALSWHFLEAPINRMKERFPYLQTARRVAANLSA